MKFIKTGIKAVILFILTFGILGYMAVAIFFKKIFSFWNKEKVSDFIDKRISKWAENVIKATTFFVNFDIEIINQVGELPKNFLIVANHQSFIDTLVIPRTFKEQKIRFIAKRSLGKWNTLGTGAVLKNQENALIDRGKNLKETFGKIRQLAINAQKKDFSIILFPEGTRSKTGEIMPFKKGALDIVLKNTTMPILCVVLDGGYKLPHLSSLIPSQENKLTYYLVMKELITSEERAKMKIPELIEKCKISITEGLNKLREENG